MTTQTHLPIGSIQPGKLQPRRYFDPSEAAELCASVRANGVLQPILVRPNGENSYEIIAGERRWRAAREAFGEAGTIPAFVREMSDEEAQRAALVENTVRAGMSPMEEAEAAAQTLEASGGDLAEAARRLGWSAHTLERRLALLNCSRAVRDALIQRTIKLGHAELLAAAPQDKQDKVLDAITQHGLTVEFVRDNLLKASRDLRRAIFDKGECEQCPHNSTRQATLFSESIADGHCTNPPCYEAKTTAKIESIRGAVAEEFPAVKVIRVGEQPKVIRLVAEGTLGVGAEQAKACRTCGDYGATVSALPDSLGEVTRGLCFNGVCNAEKIAAWTRARAEAEAQAKASDTERAAERAPAGAKTGGAKAPGKSAATAAKKAPPAAKPASVSRRVLEYREKEWRALAAHALFNHPAHSVSVLAMLAVFGKTSAIDADKMSALYGRIFGVTPATALHKPHAADLTRVLGAPQAAQATFVTALAASAMKAHPAHSHSGVDLEFVLMVIDFVGADIAARWRVNREFLDLLTKSEIEAVAEEIGLKAHLGSGYGKLVAGKRDALIDGLLGVEGFDYAGRVPAMMVPPKAQAVTMRVDEAAPADDQAAREAA